MGKPDAGLLDQKSRPARDSESLHTEQSARPWHLYTRARRATFLWVLFGVGVSNYVDKNVISVLLEQIKTEFQVSDSMLGLLSGISFALLYATLGIPVARWADRGDRTVIITLSLSIWSVMTIVCGFTSNFWQLVAARFGVGAGEAGAIPPAQSLIADYYSPSERGKAIGIFMMSGSAGYVLGLIVGGLIAEEYGWRVTFIVVGLAGFVLTPLTHLILKEPRRVPEFALRAASAESVISSVRALVAKPAYCNLLGGIVVYFLMCYGAFVFIVSFMIRVHGLSTAEAGVRFGAVSALGAIVGSIGGGHLADRLAARNIAWLARVSGLGLIAAIPLYELALWSPSVAMMTGFLFVASILQTAAVPAAFCAVHIVCGSRRRAFSMALVLFCANLLGLGLGPIVTGVLSDEFGSVYGSGEGLRYALMTVVIVLIPAGWLLLRAARHLERDAED